MGCAKGDDANGAAAQGGAVSSEGRCDPVEGCWRPMYILAHSGIPPLPDRRFASLLVPRSGEPWRCALWHRSSNYDLRRAPYDHPDFTGNALNEDLFGASLI